MRQFERKVTLKNLEISETLAQVADRIKDPCGIPMGKKMMPLDDNEEFVAMVLSFAERKSMTISNIKDAIQEAVAYMEDNATLDVDLKEQCYGEVNRNNVEADTFCEKIIERLKDAEQILDQLPHYQKRMKQGENGANPRSEDEVSESCEMTDESQDKVMTKRIFDLLLRSYAPDGISVQEVDKVLRKVHEMFVCTTIIPIDDAQQD